MRKTLGDVTVDMGDAYTVTTFPDGLQLVAMHSEQPGQAETAARLGYPNADAMNREHDAFHSLLAHWLGLPCSPTLHAAASGRRYPHWREEEDAVLAVQRFALAAGIDITRLT